jgi:hypothetical protein
MNNMRLKGQCLDCVIIAQSVGKCAKLRFSSSFMLGAVVISSVPAKTTSGQHGYSIYYLKFFSNLNTELFPTKQWLRHERFPPSSSAPLDP